MFILIFGKGLNTKLGLIGVLGAKCAMQCVKSCFTHAAQINQGFWDGRWSLGTVMAVEGE